MDISPREQTIAFLRRAQKILITAPEKWGGDEVAGLLTLHRILSMQGKEVVSLASSDIPKNLHFLGGYEVVKKDLGGDGDFVISLSTQKAKVDRIKYTMKDDSVDIVISPKEGLFSPSDVSYQQNAGKYDVVVVLGAEKLEDLGAIFSTHTHLFAETPIVNISVSPANDFFGKVNLVDPSRSSICEILFELFQQEEALRQQIDESLATILLTGIIGKTGSFLESSTTASGLETAGALQSLGARQSDIIEHLFKMKSLNTLKIWGRILGNLEIDPVHRLTWSAITKADFELAESSPEDVSDIAEELLRHTGGAELAVLFVEEKKKTSIRIRSNCPSISFRELNQKLEGKGDQVKNGIDVEVPQKTVAEIQFDLLKILVQFQKERLNIPAEIEIQKAELTEETPYQTTFPLNTEKPETEVLPTPPSELPFTAPGQVDDQTGRIDHVPPGTRAAEVTLDPGKKGIPDWLKKSFPNNDT